MSIILRLKVNREDLVRLNIYMVKESDSWYAVLKTPRI